MLLRMNEDTERPVHPSPIKMSNVVSPRQVAASLNELWSPRIVGDVDDAYIKVAKIHGSLAWHAHENEDELFLILKGRLRIEMEGGMHLGVELWPGRSR